MLTDSDEELNDLIKRAVGGKKGQNREEEERRWSCSSCTFANHKDLIECEMCGKSRQLTNSESGDLKSKFGLEKNSKRVGVKISNGK